MSTIWGSGESEKLRRIEEAIQCTDDLPTIKLLNRAWWKEKFSQLVKPVEEVPAVACMTHSCLSCDYADFNNDARSPSVCPKCGSDMHHEFDEQLDYESDEREQYDANN